ASRELLSDCVTRNSRGRGVKVALFYAHGNRDVTGSGIAETEGRAWLANWRCSAFGGFAGCGGVVAFAVDGGNFATHRTQVSGNRATMMDRMGHANLREANRRELKQAAKINGLDERFAVKLRELGEIPLEAFGIVGGNDSGSLHGIGPR